MSWKEIRTEKRTGSGYTVIRSRVWVDEPTGYYRTVDEAVMKTQKEHREMTNKEYVSELKKLYEKAATKRKHIEDDKEKDLIPIKARLASSLATPLERAEAFSAKKKIEENYKAELDILNATTTKALNELKSSFEKHVNDMYRLSGSKLDMDDIALLKSGIKLNANDINTLALKHGNNITMLRAINDYAKQNDIVCKLALLGSTNLSESEVRGAFSTGELLISRVIGDNSDKAYVWANNPNYGCSIFNDITSRLDNAIVQEEITPVSEMLSESSIEESLDMI